MTEQGLLHLQRQDLRTIFFIGLGSILLVWDVVIFTPGEVTTGMLPIYGGLLGIEFVIRSRGDGKKDEAPPPPPQLPTAEEALAAAIKALADAAAAAKKDET